MAEIVTQNRSMAQIKLDNGDRVLISITESEIAIFSLRFGGLIPGEKLWKQPLQEYLSELGDPNSYTTQNLAINYAVSIVLACDSKSEIAAAMNQ